MLDLTLLDFLAKFDQRVQTDHVQAYACLACSELRIIAACHVTYNISKLISLFVFNGVGPPHTLTLFHIVC
jgi:hypothetical protein